MNDKELKQIPGFPGYAITKSGRVWSYPKRRSSINGKWLIQYPVSDGHLFVRLYQNNKAYTRRVHRLVLETYSSNCPKGMECRHLNGNPKDNRLCNLKWGTHSENMQDAVRHGTSGGFLVCGERVNTSKLKEKDIRMIVYMYKTKLFKQREIAKIYNIDASSVSNIVCKKTWKYLWTI